MATQGERAGRRIPVLPIVLAGVVALVVLGWWLFGRGEARPGERFTGYVVSDDIYMTSPVAGTLVRVSVARGDRVAAGAPLFQVDPTIRSAQTDEARARVSAQAALVAEQQSALARARADYAAAGAEAQRQGAALSRMAAAQAEKPGSVAQLDLDQVRAAYQAALRQRDAAATQIGAASAAIANAKAQVKQAQAGVTSAVRALSDLSPPAPAAGRIEDVMYKPGESVAANVPIIALQPDGEVKARFYVPQALVNHYRPGRRVAIACDGCPAGMTATVSFVAGQPEYTPPVIYSLDARQKLVFMVEARPDKPGLLTPGQPIDVAPDADGLPRR